MSEHMRNILDAYPEWEAVIGTEVHVQLQTKSKLFCPCPNAFGALPNHNVCTICTGQPGTLPVINRKAVDFAIMAGIATNSTITKATMFDRKHYMYPDLPKNFQITQDQKPICIDGFVPIELSDGSTKKIRLARIHMEEDAGKNLHTGVEESYVDLNRAGTPLIEIVTLPDLSSAIEVKAYLERLHTIVQYLGISDANMEEGSFRADTNISVRKKGDPKLGTKVELKNINSFKYIFQATEYEIERQINALQSGEAIVQQTRLWDTKAHQTVSMRTKETAHDYRYFREPDLPVIMINKEWIEKMRKRIPELPTQKAKRFKQEYDLSDYEATILVGDRTLADYFEKAAKASKLPKATCNWILRNVLSYLNEHKINLNEFAISPDMLAELVVVIDKGIINSKVAQTVFDDMIETGSYPSIIIQEKNLKQIDSHEELEKVVDAILADNQDNVAKYKAGNNNVFMFFVGQCMKATKGKANPVMVQELLKKKLDQ